MSSAAASWPYPRWVAHRGAGKLAPENTLAAFRLGHAHGWRMFECDVKLSADGVPFLLHDATLERTSNGQGTAGALPWAQLAGLDAGSWLAPAYAGEPIPTLQTIARFCLEHGSLLNIEIKPTPGTERQTGKVVAQAAAQLWLGASVPPLLSSFQPESLAGAQAAAPALPRALLLDSLWDGWLEAARQLDCAAVVCKYTLWDAALVTRTRAAGLRGLCYTVNDASAAQSLLALGLDGLITDRVDFFDPSQADSVAVNPNAAPDVKRST